MNVNKLIEQLERAERAPRSKKRATKKRTTKKRTTKKRTTKKRTTKKRAKPDTRMGVRYSAKKRTTKKKTKKKTTSSGAVQWRGTHPSKMSVAQKKAWGAAMKRARARKAKGK